MRSPGSQPCARCLSKCPALLGASPLTPPSRGLACGQPLTSNVRPHYTRVVRTSSPRSTAHPNVPSSPSHIRTFSRALGNRCCRRRSGGVRNSAVSAGAVWCGRLPRGVWARRVAGGSPLHRSDAQNGWYSDRFYQRAGRGSRAGLDVGKQQVGAMQVAQVTAVMCWASNPQPHECYQR